MYICMYKSLRPTPPSLSFNMAASSIMSLVSSCTKRDVGFLLAAVFGTGVWLLRRYLVGRKCANAVRLDGKTVLVTGGSCGLGKATAMEMVRRGARVILACRCVKRGEQAAQEIRFRYSNADVVVRELDLASLASVRSFAGAFLKEERRLDILINNAGVYQPLMKKTVDGIETQFGVNHLGHFLLTNLLLDLIKSSAPSRIVVVSSSLGKKAQIDFDAFYKEDHLQQVSSRYHMPAGYGRSKLANFLFVHELSKRLPEGVTVNCLCPGIVWTNLGRDSKLSLKSKLIFYPLAFVFAKRPSEGMQTIIYCATEETLSNVSGKHFSNCEEKELPPHCTDDGVAKKLWEVSEKLCGLA